MVQQQKGFLTILEITFLSDRVFERMCLVACLASTSVFGGLSLSHVAEQLASQLASTMYILDAVHTAAAALVNFDPV